MARSTSIDAKSKAIPLSLVVCYVFEHDSKWESEQIQYISRVSVPNSPPRNRFHNSWLRDWIPNYLSKLSDASVGELFVQFSSPKISTVWWQILKKSIVMWSHLPVYQRVDAWGQVKRFYLLRQIYRIGNWQKLKVKYRRWGFFFILIYSNTACGCLAASFSGGTAAALM